MNSRIKISMLCFVLVGVCGCSNNFISDDQEIISLVFNNEIGKFEHFGSSPPVPALPPDFDELNRFSSEDSAKLFLNSIEWKNYFSDKDRYDDKVQLWRKRMQNIKKKIVFFNKCRLSEQDKTWIKGETVDYFVDLDFMEQSTNWKISDVKNGSQYELIEYEMFKGSKLDTVHVGIIKFSNIGYNETGNLAVIYFDWLCGGLCGNGNVAILEKKENGWIIKEVLNIWVS